MDNRELRSAWKGHYTVAPAQLNAMKSIHGAVSAFNANIDAVRKVKPDLFLEWTKSAGVSLEDLLQDGQATITSPADVLRGFLLCFRGGIAREWLVKESSAFAWMRENLGHDRLQMGGQGGIIANTLAVCEVEAVYAHCASLPAQQAGLFLDLPNLLSATPDGKPAKACAIQREQDLPLLHWILEFDKGDTIEIAGEQFTCPKSNRFIATWDPENFRLAIDPAFVQIVNQTKNSIDYTLLAGYQMLSHPLADGSSAFDRITESMQVVDGWRKSHPGMIVHFEFASTQDKSVRKYLFDHVAPWADSTGLNEQELTDILDVTGGEDLAAECRRNLSSVPLFRGLVRIFQATRVARIQLHMFGLYVTIQRKEHPTSPEATRNGMIMAATIAAAKAGTGSIEKPENLLWAHGREVADVSLHEISGLAAHLSNPAFAETGIHIGQEFDVIAVPTILIEKPVTLVGMGDTISSLSLLGAR